MSYTEHPDIDAARWMQQEERKALELEWLIEEEGKKDCYNPFLIENIVEALCDLPNERADKLQNELMYLEGLEGGVKYWPGVLASPMDFIIRASEEYQEKRIRENVMKGK